MSFQARVSNQQYLAVCPHTSVSGEAWQLMQAGVTTSAGASDGGTLIDSGVNDADDTWNGYWVEITSGAAKGQWKLIFNFVQSNGQIEVENDGTSGFTAQIGSGVSYRIWKSPDPVVVVDSSSGATNVVDAVRSEANDTWNGYYLVPRSGNRKGEIGKITDFVSSTGTFTINSGDFSGALGTGDVCVIRKFVEAADISPTLAQEYIPRAGNRVNFSIADGFTGPRSGSISFATQITPFGTLPGDGNIIEKSVLADLLIASGLEETRSTSLQAASGSTTTDIRIDAAEWQLVSIGDAVVWNGNVSFITALEDNGATDDGLTVSPAFPDTPASGDELTLLAKYAKTTDGDVYGCVIEHEMDGIRTIMTGCKGNVTLTDAAAPTLSFEFTADHWTHERQPAPFNAEEAYTTTAPILAQDRIAYLDTTKTDIAGFTCSPGTEVTRRLVQGSKGVNGGCGVQVVNAAGAGGTWQELLDSSGELDQEVRWLARTAKDLKVVMGDGNASFFAVRIPVATHIEAPLPADADGLMQVPCVFGAMDAGFYTDPSSAIQKVPDFAIFIS